MLIKKFYYLSLLSFLFASQTVAAETKESFLFCEGCSTDQIKSLVRNYAKNNTAKVLVIDRIMATAREVTVSHLATSEENGDKSSKVIINIDSRKSYLAAINQALINIRQLNIEIQSKPQKLISLPESSGFTSVYLGFDSDNAFKDMKRVIGLELNNSANHQMVEIISRLQNQIELLNSFTSVGYEFLSFIPGNLVKKSTWQVNFADDTSIEIDINFVMINDQIQARAELIKDKMTTSGGSSIPLSRFSTANFSAEASGSGNELNFLLDHLIEIGATITSTEGYDSTQCRVKKVICRADGQCAFYFSCTN
ncbi:hypothetical protein [Thalassotalea sp. PLHSN55]|uniref:hypothetical protein n=1 Tax=Thalassotalea sp. PLHSN55 TaxID=3435888 RepID=UPI003F875842